MGNWVSTCTCLRQLRYAGILYRQLSFTSFKTQATASWAGIHSTVGNYITKSTIYMIALLLLYYYLMLITTMTNYSTMTTILNPTNYYATNYYALLATNAILLLCLYGTICVISYKLYHT